MLYADMMANFGRVILGLLAILGGFLLGNVATLIACRIVAKFALKKKLPQMLEQLLRLIGGAIVALLVGLFVFGDGGWGFGGSGGLRPGGPGGDDKQKQGTPIDDNRTKDKKDPPKVDPMPKIESTVPDPLKVIVMKASAFPNSFHFEGDPAPLDLAAAKKRLQDKVDASAGKLKTVAIYVYSNSTANVEGSIVKDFERSVRGLGLTVVFPPVQNQNVPE